MQLCTSKRTQKDMLEHAIWLNLVQWSFKKTLLVHIIFLIISKGAELPSLLIEEFEVSSALIRNVTVESSLGLLFIPFNFTIPVIVLIIIFKVIIKSKVGFLGSIFAF